MSYDDAYALLLTHAAGLEQNQSAKTAFNANYGTMNVNYSQARGCNRRGGYQGHLNVGNRNFNAGRGVLFNANSKNFSNGVHSYGRGQLMLVQTYRPTLYNKTPFSSEGGSGEAISECQIFHKSGHTADACWHRYENYVPQSRNFGRGRS